MVSTGHSILISQNHTRQADFPAVLHALHLQQDIPVSPPRMADLHRIRGRDFAGMTN